MARAITKELSLDEKSTALLLAEIGKANIIAATLAEFYDTLKNGDVPEDLCKELTLMWFSMGGAAVGKQEA